MRISLAMKILFGFGTTLLLLAAIGCVAYSSTMRFVDTEQSVTDAYKTKESLTGIVKYLDDAETQERGFIITGEGSYLDLYNLARASVAQNIVDLRSEFKNDTEIDALKSLADLKLGLVEESIKTRKQKGFEPARKLVLTNNGKDVMDRVRSKVGALAEDENDLLARRQKDSDDNARMTKEVIQFGILGALVLVALAGLWIYRSITIPLGLFMRFVERVGRGDLTQEALITTHDEVGMLGENLNQMVLGLRNVASRTRTVTENLGSSAAEILASTQAQASSTAEQAAAIQQTTATMEEISNSGSQISEKARQVAAEAEAVSTTSASGLQAVVDTGRTMEAIREQAESVAETVVALSEKTQAVGEIIRRVSEIAEQSNLLALNAAIEAAAAGEQGRSFSVVANEMKNLSDQAKDATVQVRSILGDIQKGINTSVMLTEEAVKRVEMGKRQSDTTERTIKEMANSILESVHAFQQIVAATNQQQIGFDQVTQAIQNIRLATDQTALGTRQLEKAAASLNELGQQLRDAVAQYIV